MADNSQNIFRRLTQLFRSGPVVRRKVRDYEGSSKSSTAFEIFRKTQSHVYSTAMSAYGTYDRMSRYSDFCFDKDTLVYTTDGIFNFEELIEKYPNGQRFHTYSYDPISKIIKISTAHSPRVAKDGIPNKLVRVVFDDGGHLDVTPDHKFILRDGSLCEAQNLKKPFSLMPFYVKDINGFGYKFIYTMDRDRVKGGWQGEHVVVAEYFAGRRATKEEEVHHIDFNRKNNKVENLKIMNKFEHKKYHAQLNNKNKYGKSNNKHSQWMTDNNPARRNDITFERILDVAIETDFSLTETKRILDTSGNVIKRRLQKRGIKNWVEFKNNKNSIQNIETHKSIVRETKSPEIDEILKEAKNYTSLYELSVKLGCTKRSIERRIYSHGYDNWSHLKETLGIGKKYTGSKKGPTPDNSVSYQDICNAYVEGVTKLELSKRSGTTQNKLMRQLRENGFRSYSVWKDSFANHKVSDVIWLDEKKVVYNVTVEKYHNLAVGSDNPSDDGSRPQSLVIVQQSEMEYTPEISSALDIYSEETCASDEKGKILHIHSDNARINELLSELFYDTINIEFNLTGWVRNLVKYGDLFLFNDVSPSEGIINAFPMPVNEVEREEGYDPQDPMAVRFRWVTQGNQVLENWQVSHFRVLGNDAFLPYGSSVLESARRIWRQLILVEDAMLVYRVVRSPERRVFYVDVGNVSPEEIPNYMEQVQATLKKAQVIDKDTGRVDLRYNPLSIDEDYYLPVRGSDSGTKIETLPGGVNATAIEDIEYIQKKLFSALKIPKAYLGYDEGLGAKATLSQEDVRFSRTISRIQRTIIAELNKIAIIHLYCNGFSGEDLLDFNLQLSNPSTVAQQQKLELFRSRFEIAASALGTEGLVSKDWIRKTLFNMTSGEIETLHKQRLIDQLENLQVEAVTLPSTEGGPGAAPADMSDEEIAAEEGAGVTGTEAEEETLELAGDDMNTNALPLLTGDDTSSGFSIRDMNAPIIAQNRVNSFTRHLDKLNEDEREENVEKMLSSIKFDNSVMDDEDSDFDIDVDVDVDVDVAVTHDDKITPAEQNIINRGRRRHSSGMPDHLAMTTHKYRSPKDSLSDPTGGMKYKKYQDASDEKTISKPLDPLGGLSVLETNDNFIESFFDNKINNQSRMTSRIQSTLKSLDREIVSNTSPGTLLSESEILEDNTDEDDRGDN